MKKNGEPEICRLTPSAQQQQIHAGAVKSLGNEVAPVTEKIRKALAKTPSPSKSSSSSGSSSSPKDLVNGLPNSDTINNAEKDFFAPENSANADSIFTADVNGKKYFVKAVIDSEVKREVVTPEIAKLVGLENHFLSAKQIEVTVNGEKSSAVVTEFVEGKVIGDSNPRTALGKLSQQRKEELLVFDYLMGAEDRHSGNVMTTKSGEIIMIDNGMSLNSQKTDYSSFSNNYNVLAESTLTQEQINQKPPEGFIQEVTKNKNAIIKTLKKAGIDTDGFQKRLQALQKGATYKDMLGEYYLDILPVSAPPKKAASNNNTVNQASAIAKFKNGQPLNTQEQAFLKQLLGV